ncbi:uncharacterized protein A1O9_05164 [Exophiala aquamarina CBS 119918]|uniref:Uncharacterized protein n=1 Tax=Exophiala aquamarina CBS 119918 TaxID=1182545 RepID=A0A072PBW2_9EURO|nr:uncharacterized protein A1O9_05164 [Exophiala aquamarina CBS 119918]KEF57247.1 hypothetical protein A1O9_05164 [Exophiala aquamarina CBS 119918]
MAKEFVYLDSDEISAVRTAARDRKMYVTFFEKLTWSMGDGYGLKVVECTPCSTDKSLAKVGALICGENTNPLAVKQ